MLNHKTAPVRVAIVGCGAVTELFHLPVLAGHEGVTVTALVDPSRERAKHLAALYHVPATFENVDSLTPQVADAALIATPAFLHAPMTIDLLTRGLHVLVEKPMALAAADAERMVATARQQRKALSVGLFRRLLPAVRLFRAALDAGQVGDLQNVVAEVGDEYTWQLTTLSGMRRSEAGGGMLMDMGSHLLDLLLYICDATPALVQYADNGTDGIETDCAIELGLSRRGAFLPAHVALSRTRTLSNVIRVEGSKGTLEWKFGERYAVQFKTGAKYVDTLTASARESAVDVRWADEPDQPGYQGFRAQIDDWVDAINGGHEPQLSGASVLPSVALMEQCYAQRVPLPEPWFTDTLPHRLRTGAKVSGKRVLVTGASGFIGCRLSERLHFASDWRVKALIRQPGRAVRLARMPVEFAMGDLGSAADLARAMEGCDAVVHAGIGTSWRESERISTNVEGTRRLVNAALQAGVKRFVHLSTIAIYGDRASGTITEDTPLDVRKGWDYAESKHAAEQIVLEAAAKGLPAVVLRIAAVYGPHNLTIVGRPLRHLMDGRLFLIECRDVPSNTIYIDNLCEAIRTTLDGGSELNGQTFVLSDDDGYSWGEYFGYFADRLGATIHYQPRAVSADAGASASPSMLSRWYHGTKDLVLSSEVKQLAKRIYLSDPWGTPARWGIETFPNAAEALKRRIRPAQGWVYKPNPAASVTENFTVDPIHARVVTAKAIKMLGYQPVASRAQAMALTLAWARHARIVPDLALETVPLAD